MSKLKISELLATLDRQGIECPQDFDRESAIAKILTIKPLLESALDVPLELDANAQDATFFCNLGCLQDGDGRARQNYSICLTFSKFGNLCLIWGDKDWLNSHESTVKVAEAIQQKYRYIPLHVSDVNYVYDGIYLEWAKKTWLDRFFAHY